MSRDYSYYKATCKVCGNSGRITTVMDDWLRWDIREMDGFSGKVYVTGPQSQCLTCEKCARRGTAEITPSSRPFE